MRPVIAYAPRAAFTGARSRSTGYFYAGGIASSFAPTTRDEAISSITTNW
jgi:hypothetical protein